MDEPILKLFEKLKLSMSMFAKNIEPIASHYWLADWQNHNGHLHSLEDVLTDLWYHEDQDGRETRVYPGLIALSREQMTFANEINLLKDEFRKAVHRIKDSDDKNWREIQSQLARRYLSLNDSLSKEGLHRLHLKQVFRHIPLVVRRPEKVGFSWYTSGRSIKKITKQEAYDLLCKLNTDATHIKIQIERLSSLPDNEPLARVQNQAPVLRANMVFTDKKRRSMNVSLPLMFPSEGKRILPTFNLPPVEPPKQRQRLVRSDIKIEDDPFLPSIRVHRYATTRQSSFY